MTYVVLARKWRPMVFEDVVGQEHVTRTLMNALKNQRIAHAYIFAGPRGIGKTTTARLLAKAVNCEKQPAVNPCNECAQCRSITEGHSMDVIEIDGASNRGIDEIRNLRENIRFAPASARYKIYIIDEVHMLTKEAFNALLKTLEEPPAHAIFIFATTEIHRVPLTILSRCQRFDFKRIPVPKIREQLVKITQAEDIDIDEEALLLISRKADGSMRDAESILDQLISFSDGKLTGEVVRQSLGMIDQETYFEFTDLLKEKDSAKILEYATRIINSGHDLIDFVQGLQEHFRNFLIATALKSTKTLNVSDYHRKRYEDEASRFKEKDLIHYIQIIRDAETEIKYSSFPQLTLEMLLFKIAHKPPTVELEEILALLEKFKQEPVIKTPGTPPNSNAVSTPASGRISSGKPVTSTGYSNAQKSSQGGSGAGKVGEFRDLEKSLSGLENLKKTEPENEAQPPQQEIQDIDEIKRLWPEIVEKVKKQKIALGSFLQDGIPYALENQTVVIAYDKDAEFHREHVEKNRKVIESILKEDFGISLPISFRTIDFKQAGIEKQPRTPEEILEDIKNKEPVVRKIIDLFDLDDAKSHGISG